MIRKISVTVEKFIQQYIFTEKRLPGIFKLFSVVLYPFTVIVTAYKAWRNDAIIRANVTVSKASLQWYLNYVYDSDLERIYIETNTGAGLIMGDEVAEPTLFQIMGDEAAEPTVFQIMNVEGEDTAMGFASFGVFIPADLMPQADAIRGTVDKYAVLDFVIIEIV